MIDDVILLGVPEFASHSDTDLSLSAFTKIPHIIGIIKFQEKATNGKQSHAILVGSHVTIQCIIL